MIVVVLFAPIANVMHLEAILGAFAAGLILGETSKRHDLEMQFQPIADIILPIFFVVIGAQTNLAVISLICMPKKFLDLILNRIRSGDIELIPKRDDLFTY